MFALLLNGKSTDRSTQLVWFVAGEISRADHSSEGQPRIEDDDPSLRLLRRVPAEIRKQQRLEVPHGKQGFIVLLSANLFSFTKRFPSNGSPAIASRYYALAVHFAFVDVSEKFYSLSCVAEKCPTVITTFLILCPFSGYL